MRALKVILWLAGILCLLSVFGIFLPVSAWESITKFFGIDTLPDSPLIEYAIRTMSGTYLGVGIFFIILAMNPMKYGVLIPFSGIAAVFLSVVCLIAGMLAEMPTCWYMGDTLSCLVLGVLILVFWRKAKLASKGE